MALCRFKLGDRVIVLAQFHEACGIRKFDPDIVVCPKVERLESIFFHLNVLIALLEVILFDGGWFDSPPVIGFAQIVEDL